MGSYLRKNWKKSALVCLLQIVEWGFQAGVQLLLMQVFDKALSLDLKAFLFWSAVDMAAWGGYFLVCYLRESAQARVVRAQQRPAARPVLSAAAKGLPGLPQAGQRRVPFLDDQRYQIDRTAGLEPLF